MNMPIRDTVVFAFGRMNPPTKGHEHLITELFRVARQERATPLLFLSSSNDNKKNPLTFEEKKEIVSEVFSELEIHTSANPFTALEQLSKDFKKVILIAGSDRLADYNRNLPKHAQTLGLELKIMCSGNRDENGTGIEAISASKARMYAKENNYEEFSKIVIGKNKRKTLERIKGT